MIKIPKNIEKITLETPPETYNQMSLVKIHFKFPCTWTILHIEDLLQIIELWIKGEEERYPQKLGFKGRWLLFEKIKEKFEKVK